MWYETQSILKKSFKRYCKSHKVAQFNKIEVSQKNKKKKGKASIFNIGFIVAFIIQSKIPQKIKAVIPHSTLIQALKFKLSFSHIKK